VAPRLPETTARPSLLTRGTGQLRYRKVIEYFSTTAHIDIRPNLGRPVVEDGLEVKSTTLCIGTRRRQEIGAQKIDVPELGADARDANLCNGHPCVIGEFDPPIERRGGRPGGGLQGAEDRPRYTRITCDLEHFHPGD